MTTTDFATNFVVNKTPEDVFNAINNIRGWWSEAFKGSSENLNDEFEVWFADMHYSKQKLTAVIPNEKVEWLVTESDLSFLDNRSEWTGTRIVFDIVETDGKTQLNFTHIGLVPESECYNDCFKGWNYFLHHSLLNFISTGKGQPHLKEDAIVKTDV